MGTADPTPIRSAREEIDDDKGHGKIYRGKSRLPQETSDEYTVDGLIESGREHADRSRHRRDKEKLQRSRF